MDKTRRQKPVLLTDEEYQACVRVCGARGFSGWARKILLDAVGLQTAQKGAVAGGPCYIKNCDEPGWCKLKLGSPFYYCRDHITPMKEQFGMEYDDLQPTGEGAVRAIFKEVQAALVALAASNRSQEIYDAVRQGVDALTQMSDRQHLVEVVLDAAVRAKAIEIESTVETRRPLPKGFLASLPDEETVK